MVLPIFSVTKVLRLDMQKFMFELHGKEWKFVEELTSCESVQMRSELKVN